MFGNVLEGCTREQIRKKIQRKTAGEEHGLLDGEGHGLERKRFRDGVLFMKGRLPSCSTQESPSTVGAMGAMGAMETVETVGAVETVETVGAVGAICGMRLISSPMTSM